MNCNGFHVNTTKLWVWWRNGIVLWISQYKWQHSQIVVRCFFWITFLFTGKSVIIIAQKISSKQCMGMDWKPLTKTTLYQAIYIFVYVCVADIGPFVFVKWRSNNYFSVWTVFKKCETNTFEKLCTVVSFVCGLSLKHRR